MSDLTDSRPSHRRPHPVADTKDQHRDSVLHWSANPWWPVGGLMLATALAISAVRASDSLGFVFIGCATLALAVWSAIALFRRTGLSVVGDMLVVRSSLRARTVPVADVIDLRVLEHRRFGLSAPVLRVEYVGPTGDVELEIFTRTDLDADPRKVAQALVTAGVSGTGHQMMYPLGWQPSSTAGDARWNQLKPRHE